MRNLILALLFVSVCVCFQSCETEVDIRAPYKKIPVVYGLLDMDADTQFVMINRTYLGLGNALDYTAIEDSMLYDNVDARIYYNDTETGYVQLDSIRVNNKDLDGIFYAPSQRVYYVPTSAFPSNIWNTSTEFRLVIVADGEEITALTQLVEVSTAHSQNLIPFLNSTQAISFVTNTPQGSAYVSSFKFEWRAFQNAIKHQGYILFDYVEVRDDGPERSKTVRIPFSTGDASSPSFNFNSVTYSGDFFYRALETKIEDDPHVLRRKFGSLHFVIDAAGNDFSTYLSVGDPVSSVGQDRPRYSNINNGDGIGVFSSRKSFSYEKFIKVNNSTNATLTELVEGQFTSNLCFCDPEPGSTYDCATIICQ